MKKLMVVMVMSLFGWSLQPAQAQKPGVVLNDDPGWQKIGETVASFREQDESIMVLGADEFAAIKIKVKDAPLKIDRLQVFYESGDMEEIDVKKRIKADEESDVFRLENPDRDIQKIAFTYSTVPNSPGDKADVELYGLKTKDESSSAYRKEVEEVKEDAEKAERKAERKARKAEKEMERSAENTESDLERAAEKTGDEISETAAEGVAELSDRRHDTKVGPGSEVIYIDDNSRYYYINDEGSKVYVSRSQLKDKPKKDNR